MEFLNFSDEDLKKMTKSDLFNGFKRLRDYSNEILKSFMEDIKGDIDQLKDQVKHLTTENAELKKLITNDKKGTGKDLKELEIATYDGLQYIRRNNIEISGIPEIFNNNLEEKVIEICHLFNVNVTATDIEACHRLPKSKKMNDVAAKTIVRFVNRKFKQKLMDNRKNQVNLESIGFPEGGNIFFNDNLCPYYKQLWYNCRRLKKAGLLTYVWSNNGIVKIKRDDNSPTIKMLHNDDLIEEFPDFAFSW